METIHGKRIKEKIHKNWYNLLFKELNSEEFSSLAFRLGKELESYRIYPESKDIFKAFSLDPYKVRVCIIGQDPYHNGVADGLCFSTKNETLTPSLRKIFDCIERSIDGFDKNRSTNLEDWLHQGILLLNLTLTVREGNPNSHRQLGWSPFIYKIINKLNSINSPIIFLLWGNEAKKVKDLIYNSQHTVLTHEHPAKASYDGRDWNCPHFKIIDKKYKIKW